MALSVKAGTFTQAAGTGNQAVTGVGFQPKAILFWGAPATEGFSTIARNNIGFATSSSSRAAIASLCRNGQLTMDTGRGYSNAACYLHCANAAGVSTFIDTADFVSFDADGFTINWSVNAGNLRILNYLAIGGADLTNAAVKEFQSPTSTGNQATTGVGFQPDCIVFLTAGGGSVPAANLANGNACLGFTDGTNQAVSSVGSVDNVADAVTNRTQHTDHCIDSVLNDATVLHASIVSMDSDGFTLNWSTVAGTARYCWALCLKGGSYFVGSDTQKTSTGTKATTGIGFAPTGLLFSSVGAAASASVQSEWSHAVGSASSTTSRNSYWSGDLDAATTSDTDAYQDDASCITIGNSGATITAQADLSSLDSDGFTLNWGTADATAREFVFLAFGDEPVVATPRLLGLMGVGI